MGAKMCLNWMPVDEFAEVLAWAVCAERLCKQNTEGGQLATYFSLSTPSETMPKPIDEDRRWLEKSRARAIIVALDFLKAACTPEEQARHFSGLPATVERLKKCYVKNFGQSVYANHGH